MLYDVAYLGLPVMTSVHIASFLWTAHVVCIYSVLNQLFPMQATLC